ncbi:BrnA antitoxin family protein [Neosynechococcus sphagnicola]|uniref:BrnA antitoxin family protein n=1 Tax=Neosynechococcus sphagnicola TaxID=1501145 RepID=UPI001EF9D056|nr:BrnA antitoxin family protein [Neosynechococcus sphagnicola]
MRFLLWRRYANDASEKKRLDKNRPMTTITIRIPEDVIEDLKRVAALLGFSGYQPLVCAYIGQGLRTDLERLEGDMVFALIAIRPIALLFTRIRSLTCKP